MNPTEKNDLRAEVESTIAKVRANIDKLGLADLNRTLQQLVERCQREGFGNLRVPVLFHAAGVKPGESKTIVVSVDCSFQAEHLVPDEDLADHFEVIDYKFGNISTVITSAAIPLAPFKPSRQMRDGALSAIMRWVGPVLTPANRYYLTVRNTSPIARDFSALAWGYLAGDWL